MSCGEIMIIHADNTNTLTYTYMQIYHYVRLLSLTPSNSFQAFDKVVELDKHLALWTVHLYGCKLSKSTELCAHTPQMQCSCSFGISFSQLLFISVNYLLNWVWTVLKTQSLGAFMIHNCYNLALYISPQNLIPHPCPSIHIGIPYTTTTKKKDFDNCKNNCWHGSMGYARILTGAGRSHLWKRSRSIQQQLKFTTRPGKFT